MKSRAFFVLLVFAVCAGGCGDSRRGSGTERNGSVDSDSSAQAADLLGDLPRAASVRFQESRGTGLSRESWEVEILQTGPDVWVVGSVRGSGHSLPVKETMALEEYHELWSWLRTLPLDGVVAHEDSSAAVEGWTKTLKVDIVESGSRRLRTRTSWARPLAGQPELVELEMRLHDRLVAASEREIMREQTESKGDSTKSADSRAAADSARAGLPPLMDPETE